MYPKEADTVINGQTGLVDIMLSPRAHDMIEIAQQLFPGGPWKSERLGQCYPLHWSELGVFVVPENQVNYFGNPIYVLAEKSKLLDGAVRIDPKTKYDTLAVIAREEAGPRAAVEVHFIKTTIDQRKSSFCGVIHVRQWNKPDRQNSAVGKLVSLLTYSASSRETKGIPISDLETHGLVVTASFYFHGPQNREYDGFVVVD